MPNTPRIPISKAFENPTDESPEVQGHSIKGRGMVELPDTDERDTDQAEVEGHGATSGRLRGMVEQPSIDERESEQAEVEGHAIKPRGVVPDADSSSEEAEVEGHGWRFGKVVEQPTDDDSAGAEATDDPEVEGHGRFSAPAEAEGPGHGRVMGKRAGRVRRT